MYKDWQDKINFGEFGKLIYYLPNFIRNKNYFFEAVQVVIH